MSLRRVDRVGRAAPGGLRGHRVELRHHPVHRLAGRPLLHLALSLAAGVWGLGLTDFVLQALLPPSAPTWLPLLAGLLVGLALSFAVEMVERFGYFILGGLCGALAGNAVLQLCLREAIFEGVDLRVLRIIVLATCSLGTGGVLAWLNRPFAMVLSSFTGGYMLIAGLNHFLYAYGVTEAEVFWPSTFFADPTEFRCTDRQCQLLAMGWAGASQLGLTVQLVHAWIEGRRARMAAGYAPLGSAGEA
jgi:hypothetical protein